MHKKYNNYKKFEKFKAEAHRECKRRENLERVICCIRCNEVPSQKMMSDETLVGFKIEMFSCYKDGDGASFSNWCFGKVANISDAKPGVILINCDEDFLAECNAKSLNTSYKQQN